MYVHRFLFVIVQNRKQSMCPLTDDYTVDRKHCQNVHSGIVLSIKSRKLISVATWLNLKIIMLSGQNQAKKHMYCMIPFYGHACTGIEGGSVADRGWGGNGQEEGKRKKKSTDMSNI